jgi:hypothetical protein
MAAGLIALAGCAQVAARPSVGSPLQSGQPGHPAARRSLCAAPDAVSRVTIYVIPSRGQLQPPVRGPRKAAKITVRDHAKARLLARAVCGLPRMPGGVFHCPASVTGGYQLVFSAGSRRWPPVNLQTSGCEEVTGAGQVRWVARTPGFWAVLEQAIRVRYIRHSP